VTLEFVVLVGQSYFGSNLVTTRTKEIRLRQEFVSEVKMIRTEQ